MGWGSLSHILLYCASYLGIQITYKSHAIEYVFRWCESYLSQHCGMSTRAPKKSQSEDIIFVQQTVRHREVQHVETREIRFPGFCPGVTSKSSSQGLKITLTCLLLRVWHKHLLWPFAEYENQLWNTKPDEEHVYGHISSPSTMLQTVGSMPWDFLHPLESLLLPSCQGFDFHPWLALPKFVLFIVYKEEGLSLGLGSRRACF